MVTTKYADGKEGLKWKWFAERGFKVLSDHRQHDYLKSLFAPVEEVAGVFSDSAAGTGKTTLAVMAGAYAVMKGEYDRIIYIRNTVSVRDSGFLPGTDEAKISPYMAPCADAMEHVQPGMFESWQAEDDGRLICLSTAYTRGVNWSNAFVIIDEAQNFELHELQTVHTRLTASSKSVTIGSTRQIDNMKLKKVAGFTPFEIMMLHFKAFGTKQGGHAEFHRLTTNYRGEWSKHADEVAETVKRLASGEAFDGYSAHDALSEMFESDFDYGIDGV